MSSTLPISYLPTVEAYNQWSATYDTDSNFLVTLSLHLLPSLLDPLLASLPPAPTIVDLGCGTGRSTLPLLHHPSAHILGLDVSPAMLAIARRRCTAYFANLKPEARAQRWDLEVWDMLAGELPPLLLPPPRGGETETGAQAEAEVEADAVISVLVLEHIPLEDFFRTVARLLRPGGWLLVTNMHPDMGARSQAGFRSGTGAKVRGRSFVHGVAETMDAARRCGFVAGAPMMREVAVEREMVQWLGPRAEKWVGVKVWYGGLWRLEGRKEGDGGT